jgi:hypoxanthine phosphoribosyltransferase
VVVYLREERTPLPALVKFRYISWEEYGRLSADLTQQVKSDGRRFDLVIGVARGGIPVAMVISDELALGIDIINVKSYKGIAERKRPMIISTLTEDVKGKNVLVVDDLIDEGETMHTVLNHLRSKKPKSLGTAVLFKKPWSKFEPDYCLEKLDEWVVFPWERGEVGRILEDRKRKEKKRGRSEAQATAQTAESVKGA